MQLVSDAALKEAGYSVPVQQACFEMPSGFLKARCLLDVSANTVAVGKVRRIYYMRYA